MISPKIPLVAFLIVVLSFFFGLGRSAHAGCVAMAVDAISNHVIVFDSSNGTVLGSIGSSVFEEGMDCAISLDGTTGFVTNNSSLQQVWVIDLTAIPPTFAGSPNPIAISNFGIDTAITPDGRFLLTCDNQNQHPISVIDVALRQEISTLGSDECAGIDPCSDGSVLVSSTTATDPGVRRLRIAADGSLTDTGDFLSLLVWPHDVYCSPDALSGIAPSATDTAYSFTVPSLTSLDSATISNDRPGSAAINRDGSVVYLMGTQSSLLPDLTTVDLFGYDTVTGLFSIAPMTTISFTDETRTPRPVEQIALDPGDRRLHVLHPGGILVYNAATGDFLEEITHPDLVDPHGICVVGFLDVDSDGYAGCDECDDSRNDIHPGATELCDGLDNDCNGLIDDDFLGLDTDSDGLPNACDNCPVDPNSTQSDFDDDDEGDACDLDDGLIVVNFNDTSTVVWHEEAQFNSFNIYRSDLLFLIESHIYTQDPGLVPMALRVCDVSDATMADSFTPPLGLAVTYFAAGTRTAARATSDRTAAGP